MGDGKDKLQPDYVTGREFENLRGDVKLVHSKVDDLKESMEDSFDEIKLAMPTKCEEHAKAIEGLEKNTTEAKYLAGGAHDRISSNTKGVLYLILGLVITFAGALGAILLYLNGRTP